jgi:hypothetical protein
MSEYQYYEFLALDQPLNAEEIAGVKALSRRVQPTATQAVFTYSYGGGLDPLKLLAKHYDVMLYVANWGSRQLAFRFPKGAIDQAALKPYADSVEEIELKAVGQHVVLDIAFHPEDGGDGEWIEGEGQLAPLVPLRDDLMRGDLRALYLAWLASAERSGGVGGDDDDGWDDEDEMDGDDLLEPPVPSGLGQLSAPLRAFAAFFDVDEDLIAAAAQASAPLKATREPIERWAALLPEAERTAFLVRAARGESIGAELLRRLRAVGGAEPRQAGGTERRTFGAIAAAATAVRRAREARERQEAERQRIAALEALAKRAEQVWAQVPSLLAQRTARSYDTAVAHLAELRDLAVHQGQRAAFDARLTQVIAPYAGSPALQRRLQERWLIVQ